MLRQLAALIFAVSVLTVGLMFAMDRSGADAGAPGAAGSEEVDQGPQGPGLARHPLFLAVHSRDAQGAPLFTNSVPTGYTPAQIKAYLGLTGDGTGQTAAIVDAYDDPNIVSDLNTFSNQFGLPLVCGTSGADPSNCVNFTKATPQGLPAINSGWALEISLDVEWLHAVAPKANILLVEAASNSFDNLLAGIDYAAQQRAAVISNSYGASEFNGESVYDSHCALSTAVCTFSSGDGGNPGLYPAYNPYVVAVGGTTLNLTTSGSVTSETAWAGSGGGVSQYEPKPSYQSTVNVYANRGMPDISYDADPNTGFPVYDGVRYQGQSGWFQVGGTSAGAPQWAAIIAVADQLRGASGPLTAASFQTNTLLYGLLGSSALYDVTSGSNGSCGSVCTAGPGYDFVTGLGSPRSGIDTALSGSTAATATPTPSGATATPTFTSTPSAPTATATNTPSGATPTPTPCPPGQHRKGVC